MIDLEINQISSLEDDAERDYLVKDHPAVDRLFNQVFTPYKNRVLEGISLTAQRREQLTSSRALMIEFISSTIIPHLADNQEEASQRRNFEEHILWTDVIKGMTDACGLIGIVEEESKGSIDKTFNRAVMEAKLEHAVRDEDLSTSEMAGVYLEITRIAKKGKELLADDESGAKVIEWFIEEMRQGRINQKEWFRNQPLVVVDFYLAGMDFTRSLVSQTYPQAKKLIEERTI